MNATSFWEHQDEAQKIVGEVKRLKAQTEPLEALLTQLDDVKALYELGTEAGDDATLAEADAALSEMERRYARVELQAAYGGLVARFPRLRLAEPVAGLPWNAGTMIRSFSTVPVLW